MAFVQPIIFLTHTYTTFAQVGQDQIHDYTGGCEAMSGNSCAFDLKQVFFVVPCKLHYNLKSADYLPHCSLPHSACLNTLQCNSSGKWALGTPSKQTHIHIEVLPKPLNAPLLGNCSVFSHYEL